MGLTIEDGKGSGENTEVAHNRLRTLAIAGSLTGHISIDEEDVYAVLGTVTPSAGTFAVVLFVQNDSATKLLVLDRIYVEVVGIASIPTASEYFSVGFGRTYSSGGTDVTPVNQNRISTNIASGTFKYGPTLTGTYVESHRWYAEGNGKAFDIIVPRANDMIFGRSNTLEIRYNSAGSAGTALALAKFYYTTTETMP